ncbi:melibiose:sodium transporter MelB [Vibrio mimicus]
MSDTITLQTKLSYGLGALGKDFAIAPIYIFLMFYFTDVAGLSAAFVSTIFLVARIIDAITDPIMGVIVENTRSRFGKFRPWIVIGTLVNAVVLVGLFSTHFFEGTTLYLYAAAAYILWGITYTIVDIPFWSMVPALSRSRREREKLVVWPRLFASFAWFITGTYGLHIVGELGKNNQGDGFFNAAMLIAVLFIMSAFLVARNVKEQVKEKKSPPLLGAAWLHAPAEKFGVKVALAVIGKNDQLKVFLGTVLFFQVAHLLISGFAIYYFSYVLGDAELFPVYMMVAGAAETAGIFLFPRIASALPRKYLWLIACALSILSCLLLLVMGLIAPGNKLMIGLAGAAIKFGVGTATVLSTVMTADVVDYGEYKTGRRSESVIVSVQTMLYKFSAAASGFVIGMGLSLVGYVPNVEQSAGTIMGLEFMMIGLPIPLILVSGLIYRCYYRLHEGFDKELFQDHQDQVTVSTQN